MSKIKLNLEIEATITIDADDPLVKEFKESWKEWHDYRVPIDRFNTAREALIDAINGKLMQDLNDFKVINLFESDDDEE